MATIKCLSINLVLGHVPCLLHIFNVRILTRGCFDGEKLVSRKKLLRIVSDLDREKLELLFAFLHKYSTVPNYSSLLIGLANKVVEMRVDDDIRA
ncbi:hypothetical protein RYX36_037347 [Vicia faba]